jgi:hypothetical protein
MTDKELFKILKQYKVFTKFCLACAEAWSDPKECCNPRDKLRGYLDGTAKRLMEADALDFINTIKNNWRIHKIVKLL